MLDTLETSAAWNARRLPAMIMVCVTPRLVRPGAMALRFFSPFVFFLCLGIVRCGDSVHDLFVEGTHDIVHVRIASVDCIQALALRRGSASVMQRTLGPSVEYFVTLRRLAMAMESVPAVVPVCVTPITLGLIVGPFASPIPLAAGLACARRVGHPACARTDTLAVIVPSFARQSPPALGMDSALLALEPVSVPRGIMGRIVPFSALTS